MPDLVSSVCLSSYCQQEHGHSNVELSDFPAESCPDIKIQVFKSLLCYSESCIYRRIEVEKPSPLPYSQVPVKSLENLATLLCHVGRPVS